MPGENHPITGMYMREWKLAMCKALEVSPSRVRDIKLNVGVNDAVIATVEMFVQADQVDTLVTLAKELTLKHA